MSRMKRRDFLFLGTAGAVGLLHATRFPRLLEANPQPSEDDIKEWMMGNLCRCTGYYKIIDSIKAAAAQRQGEAVS